MEASGYAGGDSLDVRQDRLQEIVAQLYADHVAAADRDDIIDELDTAVAEMYRVRLCDLVRPQRRMSEAQFGKHSPG